MGVTSNDAQCIQYDPQRSHNTRSINRGYSLGFFISEERAKTLECLTQADE